jgi:phthiocerol/phenolphthiocerol synthesis type-I polyketide synthase E
VDFLLFCSSISAVHPAAGAAAYAAANAFQDRYAIWCRQHLGVPAVSINLDTWGEVGMAAELVAPAEFADIKRAMMAKAMTLDEGVEVIERVLASGETRMLTSTLDLDAVFAESARHVYSLHAAGMAGEASAGEFAGTAEALAVMAIWQELLGVDRVEPADNFFELGGHSLLGTMVLARIRERFGVDLSIRVIFEAPTPELLGEAIRAAEPAKEQAVAAVEDREEFEI